MNQTDAKTHEQWKQYLARGGVLNQSSFVRFQERYPQILSSDEEHESAQDAWEDGLDSGLTNITAQYCAAFGTLLEENLDLRDTSGLQYTGTAMNGESESLYY